MWSAARSVSRLFLFVAILLECFARPAEAYIDPGTGSYLLQFLIGGLLAGAFMVKTFWNKIKAFLSHLFRKPQEGSDE